MFQDMCVWVCMLLYETCLFRSGPSFTNSMGPWIKGRLGQGHGTSGRKGCWAEWHKIGIAQDWGSPGLAVKPICKSALPPCGHTRALPPTWFGEKNVCLSGDPVLWKQGEKPRSIITQLGTEMSNKCLFAMSLCNFGINIFRKINSVH